MTLPIVVMCVALAAAAPSDNTDIVYPEILVVDQGFYPKEYHKYTAEHDIIDIVVLLNDLNEVIKQHDSDEIGDEKISYVFFVEGELKDGAVREYKGVYVYKDGKVNLVLANGQSVTYGSGKTVYIGATDGIYTYNHEDGSVAKHGSFSGSIIKMGRDSFHKIVYYFTADHGLYQFAEGATTPTKVDFVKDVIDFVFDFDGNMFYYDSNNELYVYKDNKSFKIKGLPAHPSKVVLMKASILIKQLFIIIDGWLYEVGKDGHSKKFKVQFEALPIASAPDATLISYFAYNKGLYEYNVGFLLQTSIIARLKPWISENEEHIKTIAKMKPKF